MLAILTLDHNIEWHGGPVALALDATIANSEPNEQISWIQIDAPVSGQFAVNTSGTNITAQIGQSQLGLNGEAGIPDFQSVLRSVMFEPAGTELHAESVFRIRSSNWGGDVTVVMFAPFLWVPPATVTKPFGPTTVDFQVTLGQPGSPTSFASSTVVQVGWHTADGTAIAGVDYVESSGQLTFQPGEQRKTVSVQILPESTPSWQVNPDKMFSIVLSSPQGAVLGSGGASWSGFPIYMDDGGGPASEHAWDIQVLDNAVLNPVPDELAKFRINAVASPGYITGNTTTGLMTAVVPLIPGPLADASAITFNNDGYFHDKTWVSFAGVVPELPGSKSYEVVSTITPLLPDEANPIYTVSSGSPPEQITSGQPIRIGGYIDNNAMREGDVPTGTYAWMGRISYQYSASHPEESTDVIYHGFYSYINRIDSPYGSGMWINGLDQLFPQTEEYTVPLNPSIEGQVLSKPRGITYAFADGTPVFFPYNSTTQKYEPPRGYFITLEETTAGGYVVRTQDGQKREFLGSGLLKSVTNASGNWVRYDYNAAGAVERIYDVSGREVIFEYTDGHLSGIRDSGDRLYTVSMGRSSWGQARPFLDEITSPAPVAGGVPLKWVFRLSDSVILPSGESITGGSTGPIMSYGGSTQFQPAQSYPRWHAAGESIAQSYLMGWMSALDSNGQPSDSRSHTKVDAAGWVTSTIDFEGNETEYKRNENGLIEEITLPGDTEPQYKFTYDDRGNMLTQWSRGTTGIGALPDALEIWTYDPVWNSPDSYTDPYGVTTTYQINPDNGQVERIEQPVYDDPEGEPINNLVTWFYYTSGGNGIPAGLVDRVVGPNFASGQYVETRIDYTIEENHFVQTVTEAYGTSNEIEHTSLFDSDEMTLAQFIDERQQATDYEYDDVDRLTKTVQPAPEAGQNRPTWRYGYETIYNGNLYYSENPRNVQRTYTIGVRSLIGTLAQSFDSISGGNLDYDYNGRISQSWSGMGWTQYHYDDNGNLDEVKSPQLADGSRPTTTYHYNNRNLLEWSRDPNQNVTNYSYDNRGQLTSVSEPADASGNRPETKYFYDQRGLVVGVQDPMGRLTSYSYDSLGRLRFVTEPYPGGGQAQNVTEYRYDNAGNVRFVIEGVGTSLERSTEYVYDELNRLRQVIEPEPTPGAGHPTTTYTYYATGELYTITDPNNNTTTYLIDNLGRVTSEANELGKTRTFQYDAVGNLTLKTDRLGRVTNYQYDALNRMTDELWFQSDATYQANTPLRKLSYQYTYYGFMYSASDPSASYTFMPDSLVRVDYATISLPELPDPISLTNHYDANGNRDSLTSFIGGTLDFINGYQYDPLNRMTAVSQQGSAGDNRVAYKQVGFNYNLAGQLTGVNRFDAFTETSRDPTGSISQSSYLYDDAGRLKSLTHTNAQTSAFFMAWGYDPLGRVRTFTNPRDLAGMAIYSYDANDQLTSASGAAPETYEYDQGGNRIEYNGVTGTPGPTNQLLADGRYEYYYDAEGNLSQRRELATGLVLNFEWDFRDRLTAVREWKTGEPNILYELDYEYDVFDRRVAREETTNIFADGAEGLEVVGSTFRGEKFVYDGANIVYDFVKIDDGDYELSKRYLYGAAVDQILAQENLDEDIEDAARVYWMLTDNQGTVRDIVNNDGGLVEHYKYSAYGQLVDGDSSLTRYLYTGRELDETTGLQYNRERWYDSGTGRWLSEDPIGFAGGDSNLYRYVGNSPTNATDPSGTVSVLIYVNTSDMPSSFNIERVEELMQKAISNAGINATLQLIEYQGERPGGLGFHYDRTSHSANFGWWKTHPAILVYSGVQAPFYYGLRNVTDYTHYVHFASDSTGQILGNTVIAMTGSSSSTRVDLVGLKRSTVKPTDTGWANILLHEILYLGLLGESDDLSAPKYHIRSGHASNSKLVDLSPIADDLKGALGL